MNNAELYGCLSRYAKREMKDAFEDEFLEAIDPHEFIVEKNPLIKQPKGKTYGWSKRLADEKEDIFDDIGFEWVGHQKYTMWNCRFDKENEDGFGRKTIYFHDLEMAKQMAVKYNANSITLTESGFSLRWGTRQINNPTHDRKKGGCGATGMGVWINKTINLDIIKTHRHNGAKVSDSLINAMIKDCGTYDGKTAKKFEGVWPNIQHPSYKTIGEEIKKALKKYKKTKTKKTIVSPKMKTEKYRITINIEIVRNI